MSNEQYYRQSNANTPKSDYNVIRFLVSQLINKLATVALVKVVKVTNAGGVEPVGFVDVEPLVNQMTGNREAVPHGTIYNVPYMRIQGGDNAVILDPEVGDIGMCGFCSRDISAVKQTKARANPGSFRTYDWADGLYLGGFLNGAPTQFVQFSSAGIVIKSPTKVKIDAPEVEITAGTKITIDSPANDIKGGGTKVDGKTFLTHTHGGVQSGGSNSGPVT
jgi:hypothetical protein